MWQAFPVLAAVLAQDPVPPPLAAREVVACEGWVRGFAVQEDGKSAFVLTQGPAQRSALFAFDLKAGKTTWTTVPQGEPECMAAGTKVVVVAERYQVGLMWQCYDVVKGDKVRMPQGAVLSGKATVVVVDERDPYVWMGTDEGMVGRLLRGSPRDYTTIGLGNGGVCSLTLAPKSNNCVVGGADGTLRFLDWNTCKVEGKPWQGHTGAVTAVLQDEKTGCLISADETGRVLVRAETGKERVAFQAHQAAVQCIAVHGKRGWIATGDASGNVRLFRLDKGTELAAMSKPRAEADPSIPGKDARAAGGGRGLAGLAFVEDGARLIAAGDKSVVAFDLSQVRVK